MFGLRYAASIRVATISSAPRPPPAPAPLTTAQLAARAAIERQNAEEAPPNVAPTPGEAAEIADTPTSRWADDSPICLSLSLGAMRALQSMHRGRGTARHAHLDPRPARRLRLDRLLPRWSLLVLGCVAVLLHICLTPRSPSDLRQCRTRR